jgi:hypothetical protein
MIGHDFNLQTEENINFVDTLYTAANNRGVKVFIFTKNNEWAATMIKINGGSKIVPLKENVDNPWDGVKRFTEDPQWNDLKWTVDSLKDFVRLGNRVDNSLDLDSIINNTMAPREARAYAEEATIEKKLGYLV